MIKKVPKTIVLFSLFAVLTAIVFFINSCKKDVKPNTTNTITVLSNKDTALINQVQLWYKSKYPELVHTKTRAQDIDTNAYQDWTQVLTPYWSQAQTFTQDSLTIIEIPALKKGNLAFSTQQTSANSFNFDQSPSITSLLIVIDQGYIGAYAMTILGDSSYIQGNYSKLKNNSYRYKDANFSGLVFYNQLDGTFVNGWRYVNGVVTNPITQNAPDSTSSGINNLKKRRVDVTAPPPETCYEVVVEYWESCDYYTTDTYDQYPFNCTYYTVTNTYSVNCAPTPSSGSGSITHLYPNASLLRYPRRP